MKKWRIWGRACSGRARSRRHVWGARWAEDRTSWSLYFIATYPLSINSDRICFAACGGGMRRLPACRVLAGATRHHWRQLQSREWHTLLRCDKFCAMNIIIIMLLDTWMLMLFLRAGIVVGTACPIFRHDERVITAWVCPFLPVMQLIKLNAIAKSDASYEFCHLYISCEPWCWAMCHSRSSALKWVIGFCRALALPMA